MVCLTTIVENKLLANVMRIHIHIQMIPLVLCCLASGWGLGREAFNKTTRAKKIALLPEWKLASV